MKETVGKSVERVLWLKFKRVNRELNDTPCPVGEFDVLYLETALSMDKVIRKRMKVFSKYFTSPFGVVKI